MSSAACSPDVVLTTEHRRFAEFCDACRRYAYIGLCYGPPGVGKTLSARHYAKWDQLEGYHPYRGASDAVFADVVGSTTVFYTPAVVNSPRRIAHDIQRQRNLLRTIAREQLSREQLAQQAVLHQQEMARLRQSLNAPAWQSTAPPPRVEPTVADMVKIYTQKRAETPDPTSLLLVDETDRLKPVGLEQVRDIFDQGGIGVVLIGMPGLEKRLSRYPQLYSRVGFVHEFRPLSADEVRDLFQRQWVPTGVNLPQVGLQDDDVLAAIIRMDDDVLAAIIRMTGGNFRLLHRLLTQVARLLEINALSRVTREVVEAARENLVIGTA